MSGLLVSTAMGMYNGVRLINIIKRREREVSIQFFSKKKNRKKKATNSYSITAIF